MKKIISTLLASCCLTSLIAQEVVVKGPDEKLQLVVSASPAEKPSYSITYNGKTMLEKSPLGMNTNIGERCSFSLYSSASGWKRKCNGNCRRNRLSLSATNNYFLMSAKRCHDRLEAYQTQL